MPLGKKSPIFSTMSAFKNLEFSIGLWIEYLLITKFIFKDTRKNFLDQSKRHVILQKNLMLPKKKLKFSNSFLQEVENKLFNYTH